jgi:hypothetical protein
MSAGIAKSSTNLFDAIVDWSNLLLAWHKASKGKRRTNACAQFEHGFADKLLDLQQELMTGCYQPGSYTHFYIHEPKRRCISAAPFRDRVVHHALCNIIEPIFETQFISDSYANRVNKGTHKAVNRFQHFCKCHPYVLRLDIVKHFPSMDHGILLDTLSRYIEDKQTLELVRVIIDSGRDLPDRGSGASLFPGDDLLSLCRPGGLPIGNLTSQFWSNCYMHPLDLFIKRELGCKNYLRYVDDFALFSHSKKQLWEWKSAIKEKLEQMRLRFHEHNAQVSPVHIGIPWLGFIIYPDYRRIKQRKVVHATRRLNQQFDQWQSGHISFAEFDASVQGWVNYVRYADSWGLRKHVLGKYPLRLKDRTKEVIFRVNSNP